MIDIQELDFTYSDKRSSGFIMQSLSCTIPGSGITCIMGPNGCGKSTLLNLMLKSIIPANGIITLNGTSIYSYSNQKKHALDWGLLPQEGRILPDLEVKEFVALASYARTSIWDDFSDLGLDNALAVSSASELIDRKLGELSGGELQRVMLARLLFQDPRVLLLDEPGNHLDPRRQQELFCQLKRIAESKAVVMVLHDINGASRFADNIIFLKDGKLVASGAKKDVLSEETLAKVYDIAYKKISHPDGDLYFPAYR